MSEIQKVYNEWLKRRDSLDESIAGDHILAYLRINSILTIDEEEIIKSRKTSTERCLVLYTIFLPTKGEAGVKAFIHKLVTDGKVADLQVFKEELICANFLNLADLILTVPLLQVTNSSILVDFKERLKADIRIECEYIQKYWNGLLQSVEMRKTFTELEVLNHHGGMTGDRVDGYEEVFSDVNHVHRIIIEGDPGAGKSTYLNMLAMDWAGEDDTENGNEFLNKWFDFVLLIPLRSLRESNFELALEIICGGETQLVAALLEKMKKPKSRILLLLDAFDEFDEQSSSYQEVHKILAKEMYKHVTVLVTTRRSHIHRLPTAARDRWLLLKGFNEYGIETYLAKQGVVIDVEEDPQYELMLPLLETPLFCAIYSILHKQKALDMVRDLFDILNAFIDHVINLHFEEKLQLLGVSSPDDWKQSDVQKNLGRYALTCLSSDLQKLIKESFNVNAPDRNKLEDWILKKCRVGLLCQRQIFSASHRKFTMVLEFPHQTFTEYFAAFCVAESIEKLTGLHSISLKLFCSQFGTFLTGHSKILTEKTLDQWIGKAILSNGRMFLEPARMDYDAGLFANKTVSAWLQQFVCNCKPTIISFSRDGVVDLFRIDQTTLATSDLVTGLFSKLSLYCKGVIFSRLESNTMAPDLKLFFDVEKITRAIADETTKLLIEQNEEFTNTVSDLDLSFCTNRESTKQLIQEFRKAKTYRLEFLKDEADFLDSDHYSADQVTIAQATQFDDSDQNFQNKSFLFTNENEAFGPFLKLLKSNKLVKSLRSLNVSNMKELGQNPQFFHFLIKFESLENLVMSNCKLSAECVGAFAASIANATSRLRCTLKKLNLGRNEEIGNYPSIFDHLKCYSLHTLDVSRCNLSELSVQAFCQALKSRTSSLACSLQSVVLNCNTLLSSSTSFFEAVSLLPQLQSLNIGGGCFTSNVCEKLLSLNKSIKELGISFCTDVPVSFFISLQSFSVLEVLELDECDMSKESAICLVNSLKNGCFKSCLRSITFAGNAELETMPEFYHVLSKCACLKDIGFEQDDELPECTSLRETLYKKLTTQYTVLDVDFG